MSKVLGTPPAALTRARWLSKVRGHSGATVLACWRGRQVRLKEFWSTVVRRWYLVLVAILLSVGATAVVVDRVGPTFQVDGAALIFPPTAKVERGAQAATVGNPYLALDGVTLARDIVIRSLMSKSVADQIDEQIPGATFEATPDVMTNAPIINVTVEAPSSEDAAKTLSAVLERIPGILTELQAGLGLDQGDLITSQPLIANPEPDVVRKGQIRAGVVSIAAALGLSLLMIGLLDGLLLSRKRRGRPDRSIGAGNPAPDESGKGVAPVAADRRTRVSGGSRRLGPRAPSARTTPTVAGSGTPERTQPPASANEIAVR